jgi:NADPH:quinone reductase-like Zn-dependent oxidoreductase
MKAWLWGRHGGADSLRLAEVPQPVPGPNEALVRVLGASVNAADWHSMRGRPLFSRLTLGLLRPKHQSLGVDVAGRVESLGHQVTGVQVGDEVFGNLLEHGYGGFAAYAAVPIDVLHRKPPSLSFAEAAAVPMSGVTALQGLNHHGRINSGQRVLYQRRLWWGGHLCGSDREGPSSPGETPSAPRDLTMSTFCVLLVTTVKVTPTRSVVVTAIPLHCK